MSLVHATRGEFQRLIDRLVAERRAPSISVACALADGTVIEYAAGAAGLEPRRLAGADTSYLWFSVTKLFTATAVLQLAASDAVDLDQPVSTYIADLPLPATVTIRHLLSHTSGLPNPIPFTWIHLASEAGPPLAAMTTRLLGAHPHPRFAPGTREFYSNIGYLVLGMLIERVTGMLFERYVEQNILEPLEMRSSGFTLAPDTATGYFRTLSVMGLIGRALVAERFFGPTRHGLTPLLPFLIDGAPYGGLVGTARDMLQLGRAMLGRGVLNGREILPPAFADAALVRATLSDGSRGETGLAWQPTETEGETFAFHRGEGGGFSAELRIYPRFNYAIAIAANLSKFDTTMLSRVIVSPGP